MGAILTDIVYQAVEMFERQDFEELDDLIAQFDEIQQDMFFKMTDCEIK